MLYLTDHFDLSMLPNGGVISIDSLSLGQALKILRAPFVPRVRDKRICELIWEVLKIPLQPDPTPISLSLGDVLVVVMSSRLHVLDDGHRDLLNFFVVNVGGVVKTGFLQGDLKKLAKMVGWEHRGLAVWRRQSRGKRPTFALAIDANGRQFPLFLTHSLPLRDLRRLVKLAIRGARIAKKLKREKVEWPELLQWGLAVAPENEDLPKGAVKKYPNI